MAAKRDRIARDVVVAATIERLVADAGARVVTADGVSAEQTPEGGGAALEAKGLRLRGRQWHTETVRRIMARAEVAA